MSEIEKLEGYCLKCKTKRIIQSPRAEWAANGTPATRGICPVCGTNMYLRGHTKAHDSLPKPEVKTGSAKTGKRRKKKKSAGKSAAKHSGKGSSKRSGKLVIVESPAKSRTINRYLGSGYKVMSSVGHVRDLLKSRLSVDVDNHFEPEYRVPNDKRKVVKQLTEAAQKATEIYLATDPDREGEAIAWHVREAADMDPGRTKRVVFQEITKPAIIEAFEHPRDIDMQRVDAQQARRILDRLVGYKLSPLLWRKVKGRLSAGRVQSVAVRLIVEREREIDAFESEEYWKISAELSQEAYRDQRERPYFVARLHRLRGEEVSLPSEEVVKPHLEALEKAEWTVSAVRLGKRTRRPAAPFTTSTLQQDASRRLSFSASKTMRVAQQLYEGIDLGPEDGSTGLITYMRTDSVSVSSIAQAEAREHITRHFGDEYVPSEAPQYRTRSASAQEAHEAVRPTSVERTPKRLKTYLSKDQFRLYRLIWERFVASQMAPASYDTVSVDIMAGAHNTTPEDRPYLFRAAGSTLRFAGFLALYEEAKPEDKPEDEDEIVPADLTAGEILDLLRLIPEQNFTQPPPRFSEASLVKELEENGIGRPSTYASIISTIVSRGYVEYEDRRLRPTEVGIIVNDLLVEYFPDVMSVDFTARMESELDEIASGRSWVPVVEEFYDSFSVRLDHADKNMEKVDLQVEPEPVGRDCPQCGDPLLYRDGRFGRFIGCSNFPSCRYTEQLLDKIGVACPKDGGDIVRKRTRRGRVFYGCANYPDCDWTSWKEPIQIRCPDCGGLLVVAANGMVECTQCGNKHNRKALEASGAEVARN